MKRIELAQYIIDNYPEYKLDGKVVDVKILDRNSATIVVKSGEKITVTGLFAAKLYDAKQELTPYPEGDRGQDQGCRHTPSHL